jgi:hypothetical protein
MTAGRLDRGSDQIVRHAEIPFPRPRTSRCRPIGRACSRPIPVLSAPAGDRIRRWTVRVASRVDAMVVEGVSLPEASGHRRRCAVGGGCNGGADRWRGFPRSQMVRKGLRHLWLRLRHPQSNGQSPGPAPKAPKNISPPAPPFFISEIAPTDDGYDFTELTQMIGWRDGLQHAPRLAAAAFENKSSRDAPRWSSAPRHGVSHAGYHPTAPPSYIVASTGWVPPVTVSSPSRRGSLHAAQTVTG